MRVGQRLFLAVVPAVLGVFTVAALAYWGRYHETAPAWLVVTAVVAAVVSLFVAWLNTRYVARRIEALARLKLERIGMHDPASTGVDELDTIEDAVERLSRAAAVAEAAKSAAIEDASARKKEYAELISLAVSRVSERLEEIRLPLHILLENHFGDLNENQEEMLGAARIAAEAADEEVSRLREIGDLDRGVVALRNDPLKLGDAIRSILPLLEADAASRNISIKTEGIAPALPSVYVDRRRFQEALTLLSRESLRRTLDGTALTIDAAATPDNVEVSISHGQIAAEPRVMALAVRLLQAQGASAADASGATRIVFPRRAP